MEAEKPSLSDLEERLGYTFSDRGLLQRALTRRSWANDRKPDVVRDNERLEFLGDAVVGLVVSERVFELLEQTEGVLSAARDRFVNGPRLAGFARRLGLRAFVRFGRGEVKQDLGDHDRVLANVFEAVLGAIYRDGGLPAAREFVLRVMGDEIRAYAAGPLPATDAKNRLQEYMQGKGLGLPEYQHFETVDERQQITWIVEARAAGHVARAQASRKQDAERAAAEQILGEL